MSYIEVKANSPFTYYNLPYGVFSTRDNVRKHIHPLLFLDGRGQFNSINPGARFEV